MSHPTRSLAGAPLASGGRVVAHDSAGTPTSGAAAREMPAVATYALRLGDDALVLAQRLGEWIASAPQIEEDVALGNIGLDLLGQARLLLTYAGEVEGAGRSEDDLAYLRDERSFVNVQMVEQPGGDFAVTMARQLFFSTYQLALYARLEHSTDATLAGVAGKAVKEVAYHRDHATQWVLRLGDGTAESHRRMQDGLARVAPFVDELFTGDDLVRGLAADGLAVDPEALRAECDAYVDSVLTEATLERPVPTWTARGGRSGVHSQPFGFLLAELQHLHRSHPGASW
jgi:ring-1,2-phenylacetyl-CoA epoxidase subunit PaaC